MRQAVNHPYLIVYSKTYVERNGGPNKALVANGSVNCDICHEPPTDRVLSSCCRAGFCRSCVVDYISGAGGEESTPCPSCSAPLTIDLNQESSNITVDDGSITVPAGRGTKRGSRSDVPSLKNFPHVATGSILRRIDLAQFATSTKIEVLIQELIEMRKRRPGAKALVFSQFVNMLDLVRWRLHSDPLLVNLNLGVKILHGGMDVKSRDAALKSFREDNNTRVLLMSLKSAGVALNLTAASEVYLLDLWWNPAAEMQAMDRAHRIGQHRPIRVVRFVAEGTVEERVLQLQEKKRLVFDGTVGRDAGSLKMLTGADMRALFT
jgi:DNA repair protein RAD16